MTNKITKKLNKNMSYEINVRILPQSLTSRELPFEVMSFKSL